MMFSIVHPIMLNYYEAQSKGSNWIFVGVLQASKIIIYVARHLHIINCLFSIINCLKGYGAQAARLPILTTSRSDTTNSSFSIHYSAFDSDRITIDAWNNGYGECLTNSAFSIDHLSFEKLSTIVFRAIPEGATATGDLDGDGISDAEEILTHGTNASRADSDRDGIMDGEDEYPLDADSDDDGYPDSMTEEEWNANPLLAPNVERGNAVIRVLSPVSGNGSAVLKVGDLPIVLNNEAEYDLAIPDEEIIDFDLITTGTAAVRLELASPFEGEAWVQGCLLFDDNGVFSKQWRSHGYGNFVFPTLRFTPFDDEEWNICLHGGKTFINVTPRLSPEVCDIDFDQLKLYHFIENGDGSFRLQLGEYDTDYGSMTLGNPFTHFGEIYRSIDIHKCVSDGFDCEACGYAHNADGNCWHDAECAARTNAVADCSCTPFLFRVNLDDDNFNDLEDRDESSVNDFEDEIQSYQLTGVGDGECCCRPSSDAMGFSIESVPESLRLWENEQTRLSSGINSNSVIFEAIDATPGIDTDVISYCVYDKEGEVYRTHSRPFTEGNVLIGFNSDDNDAFNATDAWILHEQNRHIVLKSRPKPYSMFLHNACPSNATLNVSLDSIGGTARLLKNSDGTGGTLTANSSTNQNPFVTQNSKTFCYFDASCTNSRSTICYTLGFGDVHPAISDTLDITILDTALTNAVLAYANQDITLYDFSEWTTDISWKVRAYGDTAWTEYASGGLFNPHQLSAGDYEVQAEFTSLYEDGECGVFESFQLSIVHPELLSIDLKHELNEPAHHTELYETERLVLRRATTFKVDVVITNWTNPSSCELEFYLIDDFTEGVLTTNRVTALESEASDGAWSSYLISEIENQTNNTKVVTYQITLPSETCCIGEYDFIAELVSEDDESNPSRMAADENVIILFNPWSFSDSVYLPSEVERQEYVMNENGIIYLSDQYPKQWGYAQFTSSSLDALLLGVIGNPRHYRSSPILLSRRLSGWVNYSGAGDTGIIVGNWSGDYFGGESPQRWKSSEQILSIYLRTHHPVKYGQCCVFAGVLTTLLRSVGIPCRPVTNYSSAHDANGDGKIDGYLFNNRFIPYPPDSKWNFHVWTEGYMKRGDRFDCDGWQVVDSTPQEPSEGVYQCGPAPVNALKVNVGGDYDVNFVWSEVSAPVYVYRSWLPGPVLLNKIRFNQFGQKIVTKSMGSSEPQSLYSNYKQEL